MGKPCAKSSSGFGGTSHSITSVPGFDLVLQTSTFVAHLDLRCGMDVIILDTTLIVKILGSFSFVNYLSEYVMFIR